MFIPSPDPQSYYAQPGPMTALSDSHDYAALLVDLPDDIKSLVKVVQGNLLHIFWAERYGVNLSDDDKAAVNIRTAAAKLARIYDANPAPLTTIRPPEQRLVGNCRDFTVMLCALLQCKGIPARARCGFGTYFSPPGQAIDHEDHWVVEYWNTRQRRWVMVDAQLDAMQRDVLNIDFDPLDMAKGRFVSGARAWQMCRKEGMNPDRFGIFDMHGLWFVRGDFVRDVAALNKMELLPWDSWGLADRPDAALSDEELAFLDEVAGLVLNLDASFNELRTVYETADGLRVPPIIKSYTGPEPVEVVLADEIMP